MSMILGLWLVGVSLGAAVLCLSAVLKPLETWRRLVGELGAGLVLASLPFSLFGGLDWWLGLALLGQLTLLVLAFRLIVGRLPVPFLRRSTAPNSLIILGYIWAVALIDLFVGDVLDYIIGGLLLLILLTNLYVFGSSLRGYRRYQIDRTTSSGDLPTVSLCIPARNEDQVLTECLEAAIGSDYPKLEILVLDDCSQDQTSQLVRSFAHDGVQFIQGAVPAQGWLGKNQAQDVLAHQANGDIIIFMGVDTRLSPSSISRLVAYTQHYKLDMLSVLAQRVDGLRESTLLAQLRYYWQIMLPMTRYRVPVSSQLWLINRKTLLSLGGFAAVRHKIV
ncbi:MAG TPA: glycosyltransferase, partial [Candidatus Saccharimonadales bacterium]|nr:glycosyltransferase [Candidatus Saccharimonadales bacterium]